MTSRISSALLAIAAAGLLPGFVQSADAQISKGHQILIDRGLQIQGLSIDDNFLTLSTYSNANYTSINWINEVGGDGLPTHSSRPDWMGAAPGFPWARWVKAENQMPPHMTPYGGDETPHMPQLVALQLGDEWNLNDDTVRTRLVDWFVAERTNWPNTILYHNSWGSQILDGYLADFYSRAKPDMLCFDTYPWKSVWDENQPDHIGAAIGGPPTAFYGDLRRYREHARAANIPFGIYRQTFHSVQDYDQTVFRNPSLPELRLNTFSALAFNAKYITDFIYNTGASSFFDRACNWCGDSTTNNTGLFAEVTDVNLRARNFGKALVRLTPITNERIPGYTTTMMVIRGKDGNGNYTPVPVGFLTSGTEAHTSWTARHNDPYLNSWSVTNTGIRNNGYPGDVIVSWFKPLDESFDGPDHTNEIYMMVVNGLTHTSGTAAECSQQIKLNFESTLGAVEMVNPLTGVAEVVPLTLTNGLRQLVLNVNGGDGVLFKFATGAPFVGTQVTPYTGAPFITIHPSDREAMVGGAATFAVRAAGSAPFTYRWQFNGADIPNATSSSYTRAGVQFEHAGTYSVVVSNPSGTATSEGAELTVHSGVPFFHEPFDYSNIGAPVSSNTPANWAYGGTGTNDTHVTGGSLVYPGMIASTGNSITNGGVGLGVRRVFGTNIDSGIVYFSALFSLNSMGAWTPANNPASVAGLMSPNNATLRLSVLVKSNSPSTYVFGLGGAGATNVLDTTPRNLGETMLIAGKCDFTTSPNTISMWINPQSQTLGALDAPASGFLSTTTGATNSSIDRFNFRQNTAISVPAAIRWDELRVGERWADVTPLAPPTPTTLSQTARLDGGSFRFSYASQANAQSGSVYASTNLINWFFIGSPSEVSPGLYQFTDTTATNQPQRFYQLRWP